MATSGKDRIIKAFEVRVFRYCILAAIVLRIIRSIQEYSMGIPDEVRWLGILNLTVFGIIYFTHSKMHKTSVLVFYILILINTILTWQYSDGWNGTFTYSIILAFISIPLVVSRSVLLVLISIYSIGVIILSSKELATPFSWNGLEFFHLQFNFVLCIIILVVLILYAKSRFNSYRSYIILTKEKLIQLSKILDSKNTELNNQREELDAIRTNLNGLVSLKVKEIMKKSEKLREYAFVNAHDVRGPVARILGLISLIERENYDPVTAQKIAAIKNDTYEIDTIIRRINQVVS